MAQAYRCDRCKAYFIKDVKYYEKENASEERLMIYLPKKNSCYKHNFDLCPDCQEKLTSWFFNIDEPNENEQKNEKKALKAWSFLLLKRQKEKRSEKTD